MVPIKKEVIHAYREKTFHSLSGQRVASASEALNFVNQRGFIFFWPIKDVELPSLWQAAAGNRPVADDHDDPGHITWGWKDDMLGKRLWYYARILRRRNTIISLKCLPNFYALSPNYGDYENDYLEQYRQGRMTMESKNIYEALLNNGPLNTLELRRQARLAGSENNTRFIRALDDLQIEMKILPIGVAEAGAWHYAFIYELTARHFPSLAADARPISEAEARSNILKAYLLSLGAVQEKDISRLFRWAPLEISRAAQKLADQQVGVLDVQVDGLKGDFIALPELL
jgi:hypothetical protein